MNVKYNSSQVKAKDPWHPGSLPVDVDVEVCSIKCKVYDTSEYWYIKHEVVKCESTSAISDRREHE